jgi:hypothetical protein
MEESSMQQCYIWLYSWKMMLANAPRMLVGDEIINQGSSSLEFSEKVQVKEMRV